MWKWWSRWKKSEFYGHPDSSGPGIPSLQNSVEGSAELIPQNEGSTRERDLAILSTWRKKTRSPDPKDKHIGIPRLLLSGLNPVQDDQIGNDQILYLISSFSFSTMQTFVCLILFYEYSQRTTRRYYCQKRSFENRIL